MNPGVCVIFSMDSWILSFGEGMAMQAIHISIKFLGVGGFGTLGFGEIVRCAVQGVKGMYYLDGFVCDQETLVNVIFWQEEPVEMNVLSRKIDAVVNRVSAELGMSNSTRVEIRLG